MTYVAFSRATKFSDIGLIAPLMESRLKAIKNNKVNKVQIEHEKYLESLIRKTIIHMNNGLINLFVTVIYIVEPNWKNKNGFFYRAFDYMYPKTSGTLPGK